MKKFYLLLFFLFIIASCGGSKDNGNTEMSYSLINEIGYKFLKSSTLSYSEITFSEFLDIGYINKNNYENNWVLENEPHVNFDTIFSSSQKQLLNKKIKELRKIKLKKTKIKSLKSFSESGTSITFPFFQKDKYGKYYGFIYESNSVESTLIIYLNQNGHWVEIAKVPLGIS